jgi:hypothetical protein
MRTPLQWLCMRSDEATSSNGFVPDCGGLANKEILDNYVAIGE